MITKDYTSRSMSLRAAQYVRERIKRKDPKAIIHQEIYPNGVKTKLMIEGTRLRRKTIDRFVMNARVIDSGVGVQSSGQIYDHDGM